MNNNLNQKVRNSIKKTKKRSLFNRIRGRSKKNNINVSKFTHLEITKLLRIINKINEAVENFGTFNQKSNLQINKKKYRFNPSDQELKNMLDKFYKDISKEIITNNSNSNLKQTQNKNLNNFKKYGNNQNNYNTSNKLINELYLNRDNVKMAIVKFYNELLEYLDTQRNNNITSYSYGSTGNGNSGYGSTGNGNSGYGSTGNGNSGYGSTGNGNSGYGSSNSNRNNGYGNNRSNERRKIIPRRRRKGFYKRRPIITKQTFENPLGETSI
jgi:hypothetical protein